MMMMMMTSTSVPRKADSRLIIVKRNQKLFNSLTSESNDQGSESQTKIIINKKIKRKSQV